MIIQIYLPFQFAPVFISDRRNTVRQIYTVDILNLKTHKRVY